MVNYWLIAPRDMNQIGYYIIIDQQHTRMVFRNFYFEDEFESKIYKWKKTVHVRCEMAI